MSALQELGIPASDHLREALTNCTDPLKFIEDFQMENGILLPSLRPALPFLDLHCVRRLEFHESVMDELRDKLIQRVSELATSDTKDKYKRLKEVLDRSFPAIRVKSLRPVVMCLMKHLPKIDQKYLKVLIDDPLLYAEADTAVKRQIWQDNQSLFGDEVSPVLTDYIKSKEAALFSTAAAEGAFFAPTPKQRRRDSVVRALAHMVGRNVRLYETALAFLRTLFLRTRNVHYCTLRAETLMALHELDVQEVVTRDACHKFAWCLDACVRERGVDVKKSKELQQFLDGVKRGQEHVLGDLAMILCDPYAVNFMAQSAIKCLQQSAASEHLPRNNTVLQLLVRMLELGLGAWEMIDSQKYKEPVPDAGLFTKFMPALVSVMVDDQIRALNAKLPVDKMSESSDSLPLAFISYIQDNRVASILALYYTLSVARARDRAALVRVLPTLLSCENERAFEDTFLHCFVSRLAASMADEFVCEEFCTTIFDGFLMVDVSTESVRRHVLRLIWFLHHRLPAGRLASLMSVLQPGPEHSDAVHSTYQALQDKIQAHQPSPEPPPDALASPLMAMPTPAHI